MMNGFIINKIGEPLSTIKWDPVIIDENGGEVNQDQPENTVFPESFDIIFEAMTAAADIRQTPTFKEDGSYTLALDMSDDCQYERVKIKQRAEEKATIMAEIAESQGVLDSIVVDNFQDGEGDAPFNLQLRNASEKTLKFVAVIEDAPYSDIPDRIKTGHTLSTDKSESGYTHTFTGSLKSGAKIEIKGGVPDPAGDGSGLTVTEA